MLEHGNVVHFVHAIMRVQPLDSSCRSLFVVGFTFDVHVHNVYPTLAAGGRVYAFPRLQVLEQVGRIISEHEISFVHCTPTFLATIPLECTGTLRGVYVIGEKLPLELMQRWASKVPHFFNTYGPTEAAVIVTWIRCCYSMRYPFSIGRPLCNVRAYIVDPSNVSVLLALGVPGELVVSGQQVARGYLNLPEESAQVFVRNPFAGSGEAGYARMYPHGRFVPMAAGWHDRLYGAHRPAGEASWLPHRAG